jgi:hypothetical protein
MPPKRKSGGDGYSSAAKEHGRGADAGGGGGGAAAAGTAQIGSPAAATTAHKSSLDAEDDIVPSSGAAEVGSWAKLVEPAPEEPEPEPAQPPGAEKVALTPSITPTPAQVTPGIGSCAEAPSDAYQHVRGLRA